MRYGDRVLLEPEDEKVFFRPKYFFFPKVDVKKKFFFGDLSIKYEEDNNDIILYFSHIFYENLMLKVPTYILGVRDNVWGMALERICHCLKEF